MKTRNQPGVIRTKEIIMTLAVTVARIEIKLPFYVALLMTLRPNKTEDLIDPEDDQVSKSF